MNTGGIILLLTWYSTSREVVATRASCGTANTCDAVANEHEIDVAQMLQSSMSVHKPSSGQFLQGRQEEQGAKSMTDENTITMGTGAGESLTTGDDSILIGTNAGQSLTAGDNTIAMGTNAGQSLTTGSDNILIGTSAGQTMTSGFDNTMIGFNAGMADTNAGDNTFVGSEAGKANTNGNDNTFIGEEAGQNSVSGNDNTFVGHDAGFYNIDGSKNVAIGDYALLSGESGYGNTAVGVEAGRDIKGVGNVAVGWGAGEDIGGDAWGNTMVGAEAGHNTEGHWGGDCANTFIGWAAGWDNGRENTGTAQANTYLGWAAGFSNRLGTNNVIIGACSDSSSITCDFSDGYEWSGPSRTGVDKNIESVTAIGSQIIIKGNYGVSIGDQSTVTQIGGIAVGAEASVTAQGSIAIGRSSSVGNSNSIAIGTGATVTTANSMALGGVGTYRVSVGIGTSSPNSMASLELADTDKGFLPNRMTTAERNSLALNITEAGMMVYDTDEEKLYMWNGQMSVWSAQNGDTGTGTDGGLISGMALNGETLAILEAGTTHSVDLSSLVHDITGVALNGDELVITEAGNNHSVDLSSLVSAADADADTTNELITGVFLNGQSLEITEYICDTFISGYSCNDRTRLNDAETGTDADCLTACKDGGYTCCRLNYDWSPPRCHGGTSGFSALVNQKHHSAMVCQTNNFFHSVDLSSLVDDADADAANELITNMVLNGQTLEITEGGATHQVDMSGLSLAQTSPNDADADAANELITNMVLNGQTLEITEGGATHQVDMSGLSLAQTSPAQADVYTLVSQLQRRIEELERSNEELARRLQKVER